MVNIDTPPLPAFCGGMHRWCAVLITAGFALAGPSQLLAQQQLPGMVVSVPQAQPQTEATPHDRGAKRPPAKQATPKAPSKSAAASPGGGSGSGSGQSILVLVNDDPITAYEVEQRTRLMSLQTNINERAQDNFKRMIQAESTQQRLRALLQETVQAHPGKSRDQLLAIFEERKKQFAQDLQRQAVDSARSGVLPGLKKGALQELIEERLKLQEAKRLSISVEDGQVDDIVKGLAERNKMTPDQFAQHLKGMGADISSMKSRFRASLAWSQVVRRKFSSQISIDQRELERMVTSAEGGEDDVTLQLQRIVLATPSKLDQKSMAQRFEMADSLRRQFKGCASMSTLAGKTADVKFENMGNRKASTISEPTRTLLLNAKDNEMVPPSLAASGIELYAVCGRTVVKADDTKRDQVAQELQQKEFEVQARRHLRDLKTDAHIEYR